MNFGELKSLVHVSTQADGLLGVIPLMVNEAKKQIQQNRSWNCMKSTLTLTLNEDRTTANLPEEFKEPQRGPHALRATDTSSEGFEQWRLVSPQELDSLTKLGAGTSRGRACIETVEDAGQQLRIGGSSESSMGTITGFLLDAYVFLPDLEDDEDVDFFTTNYPMLIVHKAKALIYEQLDSDPNAAGKADRSHAAYAGELHRATLDDALRETSGRSIRMGGT